MDVFLWLRIQVTVVHLCHLAVSRENIVQEVRVGRIKVEEDQGEDEHDARSVRPVSGVTVVTVRSAWIWSSLAVQAEPNRRASWGSVYRYVAVVQYIHLGIHVHHLCNYCNRDVLMLNIVNIPLHTHNTKYLNYTVTALYTKHTLIQRHNWHLL